MPTHASESERYLGVLAERAFLKLWCYPNLFIKKGGAKELCDLLLIFGEDIAIFSDKHCEFGDGTQPERVRWRRWHEEAVLGSATSDGPPRPDMFVYTFTVDGGDPVRVPEHLLTASQAELARRILRPDTATGSSPGWEA
jgi:hypothetical protein